MAPTPPGDGGVAAGGRGGGRRRPEDGTDHAVGIPRLLPVGAAVKAGEPLALVHARGIEAAEQAAASIAAAYSISDEKPRTRPAVIRRVAPTG